MPSKKKVDLDGLIDEAIADAHDHEEAEMGFEEMLVEKVKVPFRGKVIGEEVEVTGFSLDDDGVIAACVSKGEEFDVPVLRVAIPHNLQGREWLDAYRRFRHRGGGVEDESEE
ncbi:MAG: hypothetical protein ACYCPN_06905 [Thermoplasmata archaeon]